MSDISGGLNAGSAFVLVLPDMSQFGSQMQAQVSRATAQAGAMFGGALTSQAGAAGTSAGRALSSGISSGASQANAQIRTVGQSMLYLSGQAGPVGSIFTQLGNAIATGFRQAASSAEDARSRISSALQGIGAGALALGVIFESFAGPLEKAMADIETTVTNTGRSWDDYKERVAAVEKQAESLGFKNADTIAGLSRLTAAFNDPNKAIDESRQVMILAGAAHESFADAAKQVSSALAGNFRAFKQFGINLKDNFVTQSQADAANKKYADSLVALGDAQQRQDDFEARLDQNRQNRIEQAASALEAADQRMADADQNLVDLRARQADQNDAQAQKEIDADQRVVDAEENLSTRRIELAAAVKEAEENLATRQIELAQAVMDAKQRQQDDAAAGADSIAQAEENLQDLQQRIAAKGNPRLLAELAQQAELKRANDAIVKAKEAAAAKAISDAKAVSAAEAAQTKGGDQAKDQLLKAQAAETKGVAAAEKQLQKAQEERAKVATEAHKLAMAQAVETRKALEAESKAADALAVAREKAAKAGDPTLAETQEAAKLAETLERKRQAVEDDKNKAEEMNAAVADNAAKTQAALDQVDAKFHGQLEKRAHTWSGRLHIMLVDLEDFLAKVGEKLAKPLTIAGPLAFLGGSLLRGGGKAAAAAGGTAVTLGAEGAAAAANGFSVGGLGAAAASGGVAAGAEGAGAAAAGVASFATGVGEAALVVAALGGAMKLAYDHITVFHKAWDDGWKNSSRVIREAWEGVLQPTFTFIGDHWRGLIEIVAPGFYFIVDHWKAIASGAQTMWDDVKPVLGFFVDLGLAVVIDSFKIWWHVGEDAFNGVALVVKTVWRDVLEPTFGFIADHLGEGSNIGKAMSFLRTAWDGLWNGMSSIVSAVWSDIEGAVLRGVSAIGTIVAKVLGIVATVAEHIPGAGDIASTLRDAQHSVQDWGKKDDGVGVPKPVSGAVASAAYTPMMATGGALGWTPIGAGFVTSQETAIVHEGGSYPEVVIPTDPAHRDNARKLVSWVAPKLMAGGGWLGSLVSGVESAVGDVTGFISDIARKGGANVLSAAWPTLPVGDNILSLIPGGVNALRQAVINAIRGRSAKGVTGAGTGADVGGSGWQELENFLTALGIGHRRTSDFREGDPGYHGRGLAADFVGADDSEAGMVAIFDAFHSVAAQMAELIHNPSGGVKNGQDVDPSFWGSATWEGHRDHVHAAIEEATRLHAGPSSSGGGTGGSNDLDGWITEALRLGGKPETWHKGIYDRAMQESSGDPRAVNNWDSNAAEGHPTQGIMQMRDDTFARWALPGHTDIFNPVDNIASADNYIEDRYGDPYHLPAGGYSTGGVLAANWAGIMDEGGVFRPGFNVAYNGLGRDERLSPVGDNSIADIAAAMRQVLDGMAVHMDGEKVGKLVAGPVSFEMLERQLSRGAP